MEEDYYKTRKAENRKIVKIIVGVVVGFLLFITVISSIRFVGTGQVGVVTQWGKVQDRELGEGAHLVAPWGVQRVTKYDVKVLKTETDASAASKDLQDVNGKLVVNYSLEPSKVRDVHQQVGKKYQETLIDPAIQEVFKAASAKYDASQLITDRQAVKGDSYATLRDRLAPYGIKITDLSITNFSFSKEFNDALEAKQVAKQNAERAKFNLEASITDAKAQKEQSITLSKLYLQKQAIERWDGKLPQYLGGGTVFNIPLR